MCLFICSLQVVSCIPPYAEFNSIVGKVVALRYNKEFVDKISDGQVSGILLDQTCFYAEQGGQLFDTGFMTKMGDEVNI